MSQSLLTKFCKFWTTGRLPGDNNLLWNKCSFAECLVSISMNKMFLPFGNKRKTLFMSQMVIWPNFASFELQEGLQKFWRKQVNTQKYLGTFCRSSHRKRSERKGVLRNFAKFTGKHLLKSGISHRCFPVKFSKFLRTLFSQNTSGGLLLFLNETFPTAQKLVTSILKPVCPKHFHSM